MMDAHYPLQALLYSAALHRFLRWRLREDAATYPSATWGVLYLFLRAARAGRPDGQACPRGPPCGHPPRS